MDGCDEVGGNLVAESLNSTGDYVLGHLGSIESWIARFAPHDFEIRFTESGSFALNDLYNRASWVPFELWDIGSTGPYRVNDPADDVQLIPVISVWDSDDLCNFIYGLASTSAPLGLDWEGTATIHAEYPSTSYADWEAVAAPLVETDPADCPTIENGQVFRTWDRLFPLANLKFYGNPDGPNYRPEGPPAGTIIRFYTTSYGVSPPIPAAPGDGMAGVLQPLMLWWNAPTDERDTFLESHVQVAADSDFSTLVMQDSLESDHTTVVGLAHGSTYYWRVRSREQLGLFSDWSEAWSFAVGGAVAVEGGTPGIPARYELAANYPNPFNPTTTIRFALPQAGRARLTVFDVLGRRVATLVDEALAPGWHDVQWNASGWPSGLYFYRLEAGAFRETKSMLLVK